MNNYSIGNMKDPVNNSDPLTKSYFRNNAVSTTYAFLTPVCHSVEYIAVATYVVTTVVVLFA